MISITHPALLAVLAITLVSMFALGFYWLATKGRIGPHPSPITPPSVPGEGGQRPTSDVDELAEWESSRIDTLNIGRKAGGTIGSVAGATSGMAMALSGAEAGAAVGAIGGPIASIFGGLAGAVIAGLVGSAAGCAAGSVVGAAIDDNMLNNYRCRSCGHVFGSTNG